MPPAPEFGSSFDHNGPRLMITHIVNENFKSYAGTQTLGPFHKVFVDRFSDFCSGNNGNYFLLFTCICVFVCILELNCWGMHFYEIACNVILNWYDYV